MGKKRSIRKKERLKRMERNRLKNFAWMGSEKKRRSNLIYPYLIYKSIDHRVPLECVCNFCVCMLCMCESFDWVCKIIKLNPKFVPIKIYNLLRWKFVFYLLSTICLVSTFRWYWFRLILAEHTYNPKRERFE